MSKSRWIVVGGLLLVLAGLVSFSPADVRLGALVKWVYLHGALTFTGFVLFAGFSLTACAYLLTGKQSLFRLATRAYRVALIFWVVDFCIWVPLGYFAWNSLFGEPRAIAFVWAMLLLGIGYIISQLINNTKLLAGLYTLLGAGLLLSFAGVQRVLHPLDPIGTSQGLTIKVFFAAILVTCIAISITLLVPPRRKEHVWTSGHKQNC
ncbi:MAG TPA: hypothetical protein VHQ46_07255 [Desulfobacteria bacterium]|nr:hypothetical protein [Desulfobacteria bacterium]